MKAISEDDLLKVYESFKQKHHDFLENLKNDVITQLRKDTDEILEILEQLLNVKPSLDRKRGSYIV